MIYRNIDIYLSEIKKNEMFSLFFFSESPGQNFYHSPPDRRDMPPHMLHGRGNTGDNDDEADGLGPLPQKWEKAYTENGESYFIE